MPSVSVVCYFVDLTKPYEPSSESMIVSADASNGLVKFDEGHAAALRGRVHFLCRIPHWDDQRIMVDQLSDSFVRKCREYSSPADDIATLRSELEENLRVVPDWLSAYPYLVCDNKAFPVRNAEPTMIQMKTKR